MFTDEEIRQTVKEIKQSFRLLMNGVVAQSMREKGESHHLSWGASLMHLREMAADYAPDHRLAQELWKQNVRECKVLATLLMPTDNFSQDLAMLWIEQTESQEIAEVAAMNLYSRLPFAADMSLLLIASGKPLMRLQGYAILSNVFKKGQMLADERDVNEFLDQAVAAIRDDEGAVKHSAWNAIRRFAEMDEMCHSAANGALRMIKMDDWL